VGSASWFLFFAFVTWNQLRSLLKQRQVTGDTLALSISVYLLLGLTWGLFYMLLFQCQQDAFNFGGAVDLSVEPSRVHRLVSPILIYFSLTTLATIGYGDITPLSLQTRYAAVAEGITGQLYLAILVARLVGMQMSAANTKMPDAE
jgi:amino acid transporter